MNIQLDTPNSALDSSQIEQINQDNQKKLQQVINKTGVNPSLLIESTVSTNFTGAAFSIPMNMQGIVTSSGGFFDIDFKSVFRNPVGGNLTVQLLIDGVVKDSAYHGISNPQVFISNIYLRFKGSLGIGRHTVTVKASLDAGTGDFSDSNTFTRLQAVEFLL